MVTRPIIYIVDDDSMILWLYQEFLRDLDATFKTYSSAREFLGQYSPGGNECLICDLRMPEIGGLQVQHELVAAGASLPIIFVSGYSEVTSVVTAIKAGAFDFLEKPVDGRRLKEKVNNALAQSRKLHEERIDLAAHQARLALLTPQERKIAERVVAGLSSREISGELGLSVRTVENYRARMADKLHIKTTVELVRLFCQVS